MFKKLSAVCFVVTLAMFLGSGNAFSATSKATCGAGDLASVEFNSAAPIFTQVIHTASQKDLFVDVSLECGLTTNTKVMSKALARTIAEAEAYVKVWVEVDPDYDANGPIANTGIVAEPGVVTFARRYQGLIAEFAGSFVTDGPVEECLVTDEKNITTISEDCLAEEMVALIIDTMTANSFNFVIGNLTAGDHDVVVWADLDYNMNGTSYDDSDLSDFAPEDITTRAYLGKGSVTIESVRLVKDEPISVD